MNNASKQAPVKVVVVSDNEQIAKMIDAIVKTSGLHRKASFDFVCSPRSPLEGKLVGGKAVRPINIKIDYQKIVSHYSLVISGHCKQIFPDALVKSVRCVNIHPGYNPFNRGWYPQVFSILNGLALGATIHEIDTKLDHGRIIDQEKVPVYAWDTSLDAYNRVQEAERRLLERSLVSIIENTYASFEPKEEGNVNYKKDFNELCKLDLSEKMTLKQAIDRLRALTHGDFKNAYFIDPASGKKIFVRVELEPEASNNHS